MKILFCTNTFESNANGPAKFAQQLLQLNGLSPTIELHILTEDISPGNTNPFIHHLQLSIGKWTRSWGFIYRMFPYCRSCQKLYPSFQYDIVVFNNAITGIAAALRLRQPVIGMVNDDNNCTNSWSEFTFKREWFKRRLFLYLEKIACKLQTATLVNSTYLYHKLQTTYHLNQNHLYLIYKGIPITSAKKILLKSFKSPIRILFVKTDFLRGGLPELIEALSILNNYKFILRIAGPGHKSFIEINRMVQSSNIEIDLIGPATSHLVSTLLDKSDLFIVPSRKEALGVANMEALLAGVPVISTNVGGIPEVLDYGNNGWMVAPFNPTGLAHTIKNVITNPSETYRKQVKGQEFVIANFSHTQSLDRFVRILKSYCP